jgi:hypothetical protein
MPATTAAQHVVGTVFTFYNFSSADDWTAEDTELFLDFLQDTFNKSSNITIGSIANANRRRANGVNVEVTLYFTEESDATDASGVIETRTWPDHPELGRMSSAMAGGSFLLQELLQREREF